MQWCNTHSRAADYVHADGKVTCCPELGGIMIPCQVTDLSTDMEAAVFDANTDMPAAIRFKLAALERERNIRILLAVESGSRAWGHASRDSDWDVRFVYARPLREYLTIGNPSDTITVQDTSYPQPLDLHGWDLRKMLQLCLKSNPSAIEWLTNPNPYRTSYMARELAGFMANNYSPRATMHHYASLAMRQYDGYWGTKNPITLKKYAYAIRPVLACLWMREFDYRLPPLDIRTLLSEHFVPGEEDVLTVDIQRWLMNKEQANEKATGVYPEVDKWLGQMIPHVRKLADEAPYRHIEPLVLDTVFRSQLQAIDTRDSWGARRIGD